MELVAPKPLTFRLALALGAAVVLCAFSAADATLATTLRSTVLDDGQSTGWQLSPLRDRDISQQRAVRTEESKDQWHAAADELGSTSGPMLGAASGHAPWQQLVDLCATSRSLSIHVNDTLGFHLLNLPPPVL